MNRLVVKPGGFTFRNGVTVPEGTLVSAAEQATHYDPGEAQRCLLNLAHRL